MEKDSVEVLIAGNFYNVKSNGTKERTLQIANFVDEKIKETRSRNKKLNTTQICHLTMMNITEQWMALEDAYHDLKKISKEPMENYPKLKMEFQKMREESLSLKTINENLSKEKVQLEDAKNRSEEKWKNEYDTNQKNWQIKYTQNDADWRIRYEKNDAEWSEKYTSNVEEWQARYDEKESIWNQKFDAEVAKWTDEMEKKETYIKELKNTCDSNAEKIASFDRQRENLTEQIRKKQQLLVELEKELIELKKHVD